MVLRMPVRAMLFSSPAMPRAARMAGVEEVAAPPPPAGADSTSFLTMRPAGPVPAILERLTPRDAAILRASGEALMRPVAAGAAARGAGATGVLPAGAVALGLSGVAATGVGAAAVSALSPSARMRAILSPTLMIPPSST